MSDARLDEFLVQLREIPWFARVGRTDPSDSRVVRLSRWEDWPGPQEPSIAVLNERQQALHDAILGEAGDRAGDLRDLWDRVQAIVLDAASRLVPFDPDEDTWHAPTAAVWQAAWTAGLVALCLASGRAVPLDLLEQWDWFARGHWPCGYADLGPDDQVGPLLVY